MLEPIKRSRLYEDVIKQIMNLIKNGILKPGDQLPTERELSEQLKVSRTSIREALRSMEMAGFLESRVGAGGGTYIKEVTIDSIISPFADMLSIHNVSVLELLEVRLILETEVARLAALRRTEDDLIEIDGAAWRSGERILYVPTFYAIGKVP